MLRYCKYTCLAAQIEKFVKFMNMNKCSVAVNGTSIMQNVLVLHWSVLPKSNLQTGQFGAYVFVNL